MIPVTAGEEASVTYNNRAAGSGAGITFYADDMTVGISLHD